MSTYSEKDIDRVFSGLRDVEPSPGLVQRSLEALQRRAAAPAPRFSRWQFAIAVPVAALALLLAARFVMQHDSAPVASPSATASAASPTPVEPQPPNSVPNAIEQEHKPYYHAVNSFKEPAPQPSVALVSAADREAMENANAPSHPAPPLPLSPDERTLLMAARKGETVEVALLEPSRNDPFHAASAAREDASFKSAVQGFLKQLAAAEALDPTPPVPEPDPIPNPEPLNTPN